MRTSAIQLSVREADSPEERQARAFELVRAAARRGAELVVLPELWKVGFFSFDDYAASAEPLDGALSRELAGVARETGIVLCGGSFVERGESGLYNTTVLFDREGERLSAYRQIHLFPYGSREPELLTAGDEAAVVSVEGARLGLATCFDLRFPELFRDMIEQGAEVFVVVAAWPFPRLAAWQTMIRARAIENQAAIVACNCADGKFAGASQANDAWGTTLGELSERPGVLRCELDVDAVRSARAEFPLLAGRRLAWAGASFDSVRS